MTALDRGDWSSGEGSTASSARLGTSVPGGASCFVVSAQRQTTHIVDTHCSCSDTCSHHPVLAVTQVGAVPLQLRRLPGRVTY